MNQKKLYAWMVAGSALGLVASSWQLMEKIALLKNKDVILSCNLNSVFSCSNVLSSHQASIFGPPNALIGVMMFSFFLTVALLGATGSKVAKKFIFVIEGLVLFMLGFTLWFLYQSVFNIHSVCIFCIFVGTGVLTINAVMLRQSLPLLKLNAKAKAKVERLFASGADIFGWIVLWLSVALVMAIKFW